MKKLLGVFAGLLAGVAFAGDYHLGSTLRCSECHTMHASRTHGLNQEALEADFVAITGGPNRNLLLNDGTNATCLACHDAKATFPDVLGTNGGMVLPGTRSAGALNVAAASGLPAAGTGFDHYDGHTLGSDLVPPGFVGIYEPTPQENFNCANCHAVHGSEAFRNLGLSIYMGLPGFSGNPANEFGTVGPAYNIQTKFVVAGGNDVRRAAAVSDDVFIIGDARNYEAASVVFKVGTGGMNRYCAVCHGNFHGDGNTRDQLGGVDFIRHPTSGVLRDVGATPLRGTAQIDVVRPAWVDIGAAKTGNFEAACLSCHKGHGNANGYALIYPNPAGGAVTNYENGDGSSTTPQLQRLCSTCHVQGRELFE